MESTACNVREHDRDDCVLDGLPPMPVNIKEQMPELAEMLQRLSLQLGRDPIHQQLKASIDLRRAFDADDYQSVCAVYRRGDGWIDWQEGGFCIGVPEWAMRDFAKRHRGL